MNKSGTYILCIVIIILSFSVRLNGQGYSFTHYQTKDGLPNNSIICITQDKMGFMWFGTGDSLSRFDGSSFKNYYPDTKGKASSDYIRYLTTDKNGNIWAGMQMGIFMYDAKKDALVPFLDSIKNITSLYFDQKNTLWICAKEKLYAYSFRNHKIRRYIAQNKYVNTCITEAGARIWVGTDNGILYKLDPVSGNYESSDVFDKFPKTILKSITKLVAINDTSILLGTAMQGVIKYNIRKESCQYILRNSEDSDFIHVSDIVQINNHEFWIASETGIFIYNDSTRIRRHIRKRVNNPYYLSDNSCYAVFKDRGNGIWIGTYFGGLNYYNVLGSSRFTKYLPDNTQNSISGSAIRDFCRDNFNNIWIGTEDAGLNKLNLNTDKIRPIHPYNSLNNKIALYRNIQSIAVAGDKLWVGTYLHGIDILDCKSSKIIKHYDSKTTKGGLGNDWATSLLYTRGKNLFVGTEIGLYKYVPDKDNFRQIYLEENKEKHFITSLLEDTHNNVWVGTHSSGLYSINISDGNLQHYSYVNNNAAEHGTQNAITSLYEDDSDTLWVSMGNGGLCFLDPENRVLTRLNNESAFHGNYILDVKKDKYKRIWIATLKGLIKLDADRKAFTKYTINDGLPTNEFNFKSSIKDDNGNLYFGTTNGIIKFNPDDFRKVNFRPPLYITEFNIGNKEITPSRNPDILKQSIVSTDTIILNYKQSSFNIGFSALTYSSSLSTNYAYILEGLENTWTKLNAKRNAYFTNLYPGTYTFKVKAFAKEYLPTKERRLTIIIKPPLWATKWAYLLYSLFAALLLYLLVRYYSTRIQLKRDRELYEAKMSFFTNIAHEIKTPLSLIKGPLENISEHSDSYPEIMEDIEMMDKNSNRLVTLINQLMDFRQTESNGFRLNYSETNLSAMIKEIYNHFKSLKQFRNKDFQLYLPAEDKIIYTDKEALEKIINNLISNAVKFAQARVAIELIESTGKNKHLSLIFKNDGPLIPENEKEKIFQPFVRIQQTAYVPGTGIGLALSKNLAELLEYSLTLSETEKNINAFVLTMPI